MKNDSGFTLTELLMTTVLMLLLGGLGVTALQGYARAQAFQGTADEVVSSLRTTAQRALSEGRTYCVHMDDSSDTWSVWQRSCSSSGVRVDQLETRSGVSISSPSFSSSPSHSCPAPGTCVYFYPRGTGSPGTLQVTRPGADAITVTVEGLSSRVSRS